MDSELTAATFTPHLNTVFTFRSEAEEDLPLTLVAVDELVAQPHAPRPEPFSLTFTGPAGYAFTQGMYLLRHETLGTLDVFLVPREPHADRLPRLDAVFN